MTSSETQIHLKSLFRGLFACIVLALIFAILGVYDSDALALPYRLVFWTVIMCLGGLVVGVAEPLIFGKLTPNAHPIFQILLISVIVSGPITLFLAGLNTDFKYDFTAENWFMQFFGVLIISVIIVTGRYVFSYVVNLKSGNLKSGKNSATNAALDPIKRFLKRLPLKFENAHLYALSSEGHYLRVHTDKGSPLILMRMTDAARELAEADGLQVHRSWWVCRNAILETTRKRGQRFLRLKDGTLAPVSRSCLPKVQEAGLDH